MEKSTLHENILQWKKVLAQEFCNGRKFLHRNFAMEESQCKGLSSCHNRTIAHLKIDQQGVSKVSERCQQGVNKLSTRCQICNHLPRKKCKSSYLSFVCRQKIIFVFVFAFVICFLEGGTRSKKKFDILEKWKKWKMENGKWKNGKMEGGEQMGVLIIGQSLRPTDTLRECNIIKLIDY